MGRSVSGHSKNTHEVYIRGGGITANPYKYTILYKKHPKKRGKKAYILYEKGVLFRDFRDLKKKNNSKICRKMLKYVEQKRIM